MTYLAAILTGDSREKLIGRFSQEIPEEWSVIADHMTIRMGKPKREHWGLIGTFLTLTIDAIAKDDNVMAVRVIPWGPFYIAPKEGVPHITLAMNRAEGAKPAMSKNLINWKEIDEPFTLRAQIQEKI